MWSRADVTHLSGRSASSFSPRSSAWSPSVPRPGHRQSLRCYKTTPMCPRVLVWSKSFFYIKCSSNFVLSGCFLVTSASPLCLYQTFLALTASLRHYVTPAPFCLTWMRTNAPCLWLAGALVCHIYTQMLNYILTNLMLLLRLFLNIFWIALLANSYIFVTDPCLSLSPESCLIIFEDRDLSYNSIF